jgi:hypothetical protein
MFLFPLFYVGIRPLHLPFFDLGAFLPDIKYGPDGTRSLDISIRSFGLSLKGEVESSRSSQASDVCSGDDR